MGKGKRVLRVLALSLAGIFLLLLFWGVSGTVSILDCTVVPGGRPGPSGRRPSAGTQGWNFSNRSDGSRLVDTGRIHGAAGDPPAGFPIKNEKTERFYVI